ncbi:alpha/beta hydrolase [Streptomyces fuscichromogenes]|nr:alpha/beta hydrolase [Streptomyces fuscichromogenes]
MSFFTVPLVADSVARAFCALSNLAPRPRREFAELAMDTSVVTAPTRHGGVKCTVYRSPHNAAPRPPVYVNVHGGGFAIRYPEQDDPWCRYLAKYAGVVVVNVDYDTAPRHRFPIPAEQVYDVVAWAAEEERDWDGSRLCVGGQSAGGSLTAAAARLALENKGPEIALQVLHYPVLDLVTSPRDKPAPAGKTGVPLWMSEAWDSCYVRDPAQRRDRLASPVFEDNADDIQGIAPALVVTAERDRLRAEGALYARKLDAAGSLTEYREVLGVAHGYDIRNESAEVTQQIYEFITGHVARAVRTG